MVPPYAGRMDAQLLFYSRDTVTSCGTLTGHNSGTKPTSGFILQALRRPPNPRVCSPNSASFRRYTRPKFHQDPHKPRVWSPYLAWFPRYTWAIFQLDSIYNSRIKQTSPYTCTTNCTICTQNTMNVLINVRLGMRY